MDKYVWLGIVFLTTLIILTLIKIPHTVSLAMSTASVFFFMGIETLHARLLYVKKHELRHRYGMVRLSYRSFILLVAAATFLLFINVEQKTQSETVFAVGFGTPFLISWLRWRKYI